MVRLPDEPQKGSTSLWRARRRAQKRAARILDDPRKGSTSPGYGATALKREARFPDEEVGVGESRAMSPQRDHLDVLPFSSHPSDVQPFCSSPVRRASLLHAG